MYRSSYFACILLSSLPFQAFQISTQGAGVANGERPILLEVDLTEVPRKLLHARLVIPTKPGPLTLHYPKWIQGEHSPTGPINDLSGLQLIAGGRALEWRRDELNHYAFHCEVPSGADNVEVKIDFLAPSTEDGLTSVVSMTSQLALFNWNTVLLYPSNVSIQKQMVESSVKLPSNWSFGTALPVKKTRVDTTQFEAVSLETLVDSPVLCGAHVKSIPLGSQNDCQHFLILACESPVGLKISQSLTEKYKQLVNEAGLLFGARHYRSYHFLVTLSDNIQPDGVEHHESSDNRLPEKFFVDDTHRNQWGAWLLPHEFVHSWNGKYRRPQGMVTTDFHQPLNTKLLWVYEGLTEYLGYVLAARCELLTAKQSRQNLAIIAEWSRNQHGRTWRSLEDTTVSAPFLYGARSDWRNRRRDVDFYEEGALLWLDVDTLIREKTNHRKSLDDFCSAFFGGSNSAPTVAAYSMADIVWELNNIAAYDWQGYFNMRLNSTSSEAPLQGLERSGWRLNLKRKTNKQLEITESENETLNLTSSLGLLVDNEGLVIDVIPGKPADNAKLGPGMKIIAVNERRMTPDRFREAVAATRRGRSKLNLLVENQDFFKSVFIEYAGGEEYPHLQRISGKADMLSDILKPRATR